MFYGVGTIYTFCWVFEMEIIYKVFRDVVWSNFGYVVTLTVYTFVYLYTYISYIYKRLLYRDRHELGAFSGSGSPFLHICIR